MSAKRIPTSTITNDDVVNELTKDLENSLQTSNDKSPLSSSDEEICVIEPNNDAEEGGEHPDFVVNKDHNKTSSSNEQEENKQKSAEELENEEEEKNSEIDEDDIDETLLKDNEINLSAAEKEELKVKAEKLKIEGNDRFKLMEYEAAIDCYTEGLQICPLSYPKDRAVIYSNRAGAKMKLNKNELAIKDCTKAIELDPTYVKVLYRRAQCYESTEKFDESLADFNKILELDPQHTEARKGVLRLPPIIEERNEKLKTEMLGKLKDLGNMILRPFGLSTENFQMVQDPETKGYSINFRK